MGLGVREVMERGNKAGIIRKIDRLGRLVLPIDLRRSLEFAEGDTLEITVEGTEIHVRKFIKTCLFCNESNGLIPVGNCLVCRACLEKVYRESI